MTENATRRFESDASNADQQPTIDAGGKSVETVETVHRANGWQLAVRGDGSVETHKMGATHVAPYTTRGEWWGAEGEQFRCGKTIEDVLVHYAHETRSERSPEENGAALRRKIIDALRATVTDATCGRSECNGDAAYVVHTNAPTGPNTALVCNDHASEGTYATLYALDTDTDAQAEGEG